MGNVLNRLITQRGKTVVGGAVGVGVVIGGLFINSLSPKGVEKPNDPIPALVVAQIDITATGSTSATAKYDAFCKRLSDIGLAGIGSGTIARAVHYNRRNPNAASLDIGFVEDCGDKTASGDTLFANTCTGTGCKNVYTTGTLAWKGAGSGRYLKGTFSKDPTGWSAGTDTGLGYDGKLLLWIEDDLGS